MGGLRWRQEDRSSYYCSGKLPSKAHYCVLYSPDYTQFQCFSRARHHDDKIKWVKPG